MCVYTNGSTGKHFLGDWYHCSRLYFRSSASTIVQWSVALGRYPGGLRIKVRLGMDF